MPEYLDPSVEAPAEAQEAEHGFIYAQAQVQDYIPEEPVVEPNVPVL